MINFKLIFLNFIVSHIKQLYNFIMKKTWRKILFFLFIVFALYKNFISGKFYLREKLFETAKIQTKTIKKTVSATGTISPVSIISVGSQISGMVKKIYTDYNKNVTKNELLAEVDKTLLEEEARASQARFMQADARFKLAKIEKERAEKLFEAGYISKLELERATTDYLSGEAVLIGAKADMERSKRNLGYTEIRSPVSGVVISKNVEEGQTIAASFSSPTLFTIAEDLNRMEISASITEADIGSIHENQEVSFTVDAFPNKRFKGIVSQIRLKPVSEQNVVIYNVIIKIDNKDKKLLPGMTAFVEVDTLKRENVKSVENYVLQYKPEPILTPYIDYENIGISEDEFKKLKAASIAASKKHQEKKIDTSNLPAGAIVQLDKDVNADKLQGAITIPLMPNEAYLYKYNKDKNRITAVKVKTGITNGILTEIISDNVKNGDDFIFDFKNPTLKDK